jgi:hypothetical protein
LNPFIKASSSASMKGVKTSSLCLKSPPFLYEEPHRALPHRLHGHYAFSGSAPKRTSLCSSSSAFMCSLLPHENLFPIRQDEDATSPRRMQTLHSLPTVEWVEPAKPIIPQIQRPLRLLDGLVHVTILTTMVQAEQVAWKRGQTSRYTASRISPLRNPTKIIARPLSPLQGTQKIFGTMPCPSVWSADLMVISQPLDGSRHGQ